jgi:hypothetical protein
LLSIPPSAALSLLRLPLLIDVTESKPRNTTGFVPELGGKIISVGRLTYVK